DGRTVSQERHSVGAATVVLEGAKLWVNGRGGRAHLITAGLEASAEIAVANEVVTNGNKYALSVATSAVSAGISSANGVSYGCRSAGDKEATAGGTEHAINGA